MLKDHIRTGGYNTISVIAVYETEPTAPAPALAVVADGPKPIRELVQDDETPPHQCWVREEKQETMRYKASFSRCSFA